jgi:hypothetical protein
VSAPSRSFCSVCSTVAHTVLAQSRSRSQSQSRSPSCCGTSERLVFLIQGGVKLIRGEASIYYLMKSSYIKRLARRSGVLPQPGRAYFFYRRVTPVGLTWKLQFYCAAILRYLRDASPAILHLCPERPLSSRRRDQLHRRRSRRRIFRRHL